jgi:hypothetical protein
MGVPFGFEAPLEALELKWNLPDSVLGAFVKGECYLIFRWAAARRRRREYSRVGFAHPFTADEIDWVCAKDHSDAGLRQKFHHV